MSEGKEHAGIAQPQWNCPSCYKDAEPEGVLVRDKDTREWVPCTVKRCPLCHYSFGGTLADRLANAEAEYSYKYFGDYELSPAQMDAVGEMLAMSRAAVALHSALLELLDVAEIDAGSMPTQRFVDAIKDARSAIAKAEGRL